MSLPCFFLRSRQAPDRLFKLRTEEPPSPSELAAGEDAAAGVLLDREGLQVEQRRDIGDRQDILARDTRAEAHGSLFALITLLAI
jgi:hypothetical protein